MLFNQFAEGRFSAIAASFNPAFERDGEKARRPSTLRYVSKTRFIEAS